MTDDKSKGPKSLINPYELLGIDIKNKNLNLKDVKQAYYGMALICHPDKGGNTNDMTIVQQAYKFVKEQMQYSSKMTDEAIETAENEFKEYCKKQEEDIPAFPDIYNDVRQWQAKFNEAFEKERQENKSENPDSVFGYCTPKYGYANEMDTSVGYQKHGSFVLDYNEIKKRYDTTQKPVQQPPKVDKDFFKRGKPNNTYQSNVGGPMCSFGREIMQAGNQGVMGHKSSLVSYSNIKQLMGNGTNVSCSERGFSMSDYKQAHKEADMYDLTQYKGDDRKVDTIYEELLRERESEDTILKSNFDSGNDIELQKDKIMRQIQSNKEDQERQIQMMEEERAKSYVISNMPSDMTIHIEDVPVKTQQQTMLSQLVNIDDEYDNITDELENDFIIIEQESIIKGIRK